MSFSGNNNTNSFSDLYCYYQGNGLNLNYLGTPNFGGPTGPVAVAAGSILLPANNTCYVYVNSTGVVTYNTVGFTLDGGCDPMCVATTNGTNIVPPVVDARFWMGNPNTLGLSSRIKDSILSYNDIKTMGGVERVPMVGQVGLNGTFTPKDKRIVLSGAWSANSGASNLNVPFSINANIPSSVFAPMYVAAGVAGSTATITWYGTALNLSFLKDTSCGTFTITNDGIVPAGSPFDVSVAAGAAYGVSVNVATGLALGTHTTILTVTGNKGSGGASTNSNIYLLAAEIIASTDATLKYTSGTAYAGAIPTIVSASGSISTNPIGASIYRKDLVYLSKGSQTPSILTGYSGSSADTLATFKANNAIKYRMEAEDSSNGMMLNWATRTYIGLTGSASSNAFMRPGDPASLGLPASTDAAYIGFIGTGIDVIMATSSDSGQWVYSIDGGAESTTQDNYSAVTNWTSRFNVGSNLTYGFHLLKIRPLATKNASSTNTYITIDAYEVYHPVAPSLPANSVALAEVLNTPAVGWIRHSSLTEFTLTGVNWSNSATTNTTGGSNKYNTNTNTTDALTFTFTGTQCRILCSVASANGKFSVSIDGGAATIVDSYAVSTAFMQVLYTSPTLSAGFHTVVITTTNTKNASSSSTNINIDSIEVIPLPTQCIDVRNVFSGDSKNVNYAQAVPISYTTTSTYMIPVGTLGVITTSGNPLKVTINGFVATNSGASAPIPIAININGSIYSTTAFQSSAANVNIPICLVAIIPLPAGTYSFGPSSYATASTNTYTLGSYAEEL